MSRRYFRSIILLCSFIHVLFSCSTLEPEEAGLLDRVAPVVAISNLSNNCVVSPTFVVTGQVFDQGGIRSARVYLQPTNGGALTEIDASVNEPDFSATVSAADGVIYYVWVRAVDNSGYGADSEKLVVRLDNGTPVVDFVYPVSSGQTLMTNAVTIQVTGTANVVGGSITNLVVLVSNTSETTNTIAVSESWSHTVVLLPGTNVIQTYALGQSGAVSQVKTIVIVRDSLGPSLVLTSPLDGQTNYQEPYTGTVMVTGSASDTGSGVEGVYLSHDASPYFQLTSGQDIEQILALEEGEHEFRLYVRDWAGNCSQTNVIRFLLFSNNVYVSHSRGSDSNIGTIDFPYKSLQKAVARGRDGGTLRVYVESGRYVPGDGLGVASSGVVVPDHNIHLSGGWNASFTAQDGKTQLDGNGASGYALAVVAGLSNIRFKDLTFCGGDNGSLNGGGIAFSSVSACQVVNCVFVSNSAISGGAVYVSGASDVSLVSNVFQHNSTSGENGAAIYMTAFSGIVSSNIIVSNAAASDGGGIYLLDCPNPIVVEGNFIGYNTASRDAGGVYINNSLSVSFTGNLISHNNAGDDAGGVYAEVSPLMMVSNNIVGNSVPDKGGGLYLINSDLTNIYGVVSSNTASSGGGWYLHGIASPRIEETLIHWNTGYGIDRFAAGCIPVFVNVSWQNNSPANRSW